MGTWGIEADGERGDCRHAEKDQACIGRRRVCRDVKHQVARQDDGSPVRGLDVEELPRESVGQ